MDAEARERLEAVERRLDTASRTLVIVADAQSKLTGSMVQFSEMVNRYVEAADARMTRLEETLARFAESSDARMRAVEQNLDALIRAITAEHTNGRSGKS